MNAELISRESLMMKFSDRQELVTEKDLAYLNGVLNTIEQEPAVEDAVPVVRCAECIHKGNPDICPWSHKELQNCVDGLQWVITDGTVFNGFCHLGCKGDGGAKG